MALKASRHTMADPNMSCTLRLKRDDVVITHHLERGSSIADGALKAERWQPVAAPIFLKGSLSLYQSRLRSRRVCRQVSYRPWRAKGWVRRSRGCSCGGIPSA